MSSISASQQCCEVGTWWRLIIPSRSEINIRENIVNLFWPAWEVPMLCKSDASRRLLGRLKLPKPRSEANIRLNWTSCAQAQVPIRSTAEVDIANNPSEDIKLCMWKRHYARKTSSFERVPVIIPARIGVWVNLETFETFLQCCCGTPRKHHMCNRGASAAWRYWEFAWELHSELVGLCQVTRALIHYIAEFYLTRIAT
jgi:hypothetical protein